ncbi:MAG: DNA polymerase III subunit epsilon [Pseudomonadota bacterium]
MAESLREIIFDTETTGLSAKDGDRVIEIGAIELINRFPSGNTFHIFLNPEGKEVHPDALEVHGISNDFLKDKQTFAEALESFETFFSNGMLVAHNASFDMGFLNAELERLGKSPISNERVVDTLQIARRKFPGQRNSLDALCGRFGIDNSHREKHGALLDSELLAEVYIELLGGKQASLVLEHDLGKSETGTSQSNAASLADFQRPAPIDVALTPEEIENHREFVESLGDKAIWKKIGVY